MIRSILSPTFDASTSQTADDVGGDVKLQYNTQSGWHMRVSRKDEKLLRAQKGLITLETRKDGVRFTTVEMKQVR